MASSAVLQVGDARGRQLTNLVLLGVSASMICVSPSYAATQVAGSLTGDQVWRKPGSPYTLVDNATVSSGASLTIEPGVQVNSAGRYTLNLVGRLTAVGTPADPIDISLGSGLTFYHGSIGSEVAWATVRDSIDFGITTKNRSAPFRPPWPQSTMSSFAITASRSIRGIRRRARRPFATRASSATTTESWGSERT